MIRRLSFAILFVLIGSLSTAHAKEEFDIKKFTWDEITDSDWQIEQDTLKQIYDAAIIFEKIKSNTRQLTKNKCFRTIYRRVRILNGEGKEWGNVEFSALKGENKVEAIRGRTILRDGTIIELEKNNIYYTDALKTKDETVKLVSFSLPGIDNDCIIEYLIHYRSESPEPVWLIQRDIPVLQSQFIWNLPKYKISKSYLGLLESFITPNYLLLNSSGNMTVEELPNINEPESLLFKIGFTPPFEIEPLSLPDLSLKTKLITYTGDNKPAVSYWGESSTSIFRSQKNFVKKGKKVKKVVKQFEQLDSDSAKIFAVYSWIQNNITNLTYNEFDKEKLGKRKDIKKADDVIKYKYGTRNQIDKLFCALLRELNIDARIAYAKDRFDNLLTDKAKYWQFDRSLVAVHNKNEEYDFYVPGHICSTPGMIPWYLEGVRALVAGSENSLVHIPFSLSNSNKNNISYIYNLDDTFQLNGKVTMRLSGQSSRKLKLLAYDEETVDQNKLLLDEIQNYYPNIELDSLTWDSLDFSSNHLRVEFNITQIELIPVGNKLFLKPLQYISDAKNPFTSEERHTPVLMKYAFEDIESVEFNLPLSWKVEALPSDTTFENEAGKCSVAYHSFDGKIIAQLNFSLSHPFWIIENYQSIRELFQACQSLSEQIVILSK